MNISVSDIDKNNDLDNEYKEELDDLNIAQEKIYIKERELKKDLDDKLKKEKEQRVKDARRNILNSIIIASSIVIATSAIYTSILQEQREKSVESILDKQVSFSSKEFKKVALEAEYNISQLLKDLNEKEEALSKLSLTIPANEQSLMRDVSALSIKLIDLESDLKKFESLNLDIKMAAIEESIEGSPQSVLSIPLIKNDLDNYKVLSDKEFLRIEKSIERLDNRLNFFVTTTVTLLIGIFAAITAPIFNSFSHKIKK